MSRLRIVPALALVLSATAGAAVDPVLLNLVMPQAKVLYGIQVQPALTSPFGQFALSRIPNDQVLTRFMAASGFDLQRDLREVLIATSFDGSNGADTLILARGTFAPDKVTAIAAQIGATLSDYAGVSMFILPQDQDPRAFAFLDDSIIAIGSEAAIRGVIGRRAATETAFSAALLQKALDVAATQDAWCATVTPLTALVPRGSTGGFDPTPLLEIVTESWVGLHFDAGGGVALSAEALTHSLPEARQLAGMLGLASGMLKGTPAAVLQNASFTARGPVMRVNLTISERDVERSFTAATPPRAAR
jgi:hypothetical protein